MHINLHSWYIPVNVPMLATGYFSTVVLWPDVMNCRKTHKKGKRVILYKNRDMADTKLE